jgi:bleomycin hydrolase
MAHQIALLALALAALPLMAQYVPGPGEAPDAAGALTPALADSIRGSLSVTPQQRAVQNALAENEIHTLVTDRARMLSDDTLFTHVVKGGKITAQEQTGRCWLFAGLNALRPPVLKKYNLESFEFSEAYSQFFDKLERGNRTLELAIALRDEPLDSRKMSLILSKPIEDGGDWNYVVYLVGKYGVVPKGVMPDTYQAGHTDQMNRLLSARMRKGILEIRKAAAGGATVDQLRAQKAEVLKDVYKVLVLCLGEPPRSFTWRYEDKDKKVSEAKAYTPQSFLKEFVGVDLGDYVNFAQYPGKPIHKVLRFAWNRDSADGPDMQALNVTPEEMKAMAKASILADEAVWFCCNSSIQRNSKTGLWDQGVQDYGSLFGVDFALDKADALACGDQAPNHCMVFIGVNLDKGGKPDKWKVENSWGDKRGRDGYWTITDSWFDANVYEVLVHKKHVPPELLKLLDSEPYVLPPWDPFSY